MHPILRFCFHPEPKDRLFWAWMTALVTILTLVGSVLAFSSGHPWAGGANAFMTVWNGLTLYVNVRIYREWKEKH